MSPKTAGFIALLGALGGLLAYWPQFKGLLDDMLLLFGWVLLHSRTQAAALAMAFGCALSWFVPHYLPSTSTAKDARQRMGLCCSAIAFFTYIGLQCWDRTGRAFSITPLEPHDLIIGVVVATVGWPTVLLLARLVYGLLPRYEPGSLK